MTKSPSKMTANLTLQAYALLFLLLSSGFGALLGYRIGAVSDGSVSDMTIVPVQEGAEKAFNWLFFQVGVAAGLVSCAVLLAASFRPAAPDGD